MPLSRHLIAATILLAFLTSILGHDTLMLCTSVAGDHSAYERTSGKDCSAKATAESCGDDQLHFDDPANHPGDVDLCTDVLIELAAAVQTQRDSVPDQPFVSPSVLLHTGDPAQYDLGLARPALQVPLRHPRPGPVITSTVLLI